MIALLNRLVAAVRRLRADARGNVLMIFGFALIPLAFASGMTIDYARAARLQTRLNAVTDAGALAAVTPAMLAQTGASGRWNSIIAAFNTFYAQSGVGQCQGTVNRVIFTSGCSYSGGDNGSAYTFTDGTLSIVVTDTTNASGDLNRSVKLSYAAASGNIFGNLLSSLQIPIAGSSTSQGSPVTYLDYYILVDISQSMGIAATQADMNALYARTVAAGNEGCVFGCHVIQANGKDVANNELLAHNQSPRITLRIDSAVTAIQNIIADAQNASGTLKNIRIGLYTMSDDPVSGKKLNVISAPSSNYANLATLAATIDLGGNVPGGSGDSNFVPQITQFNALLPANGSGLTSSTPKNYVFIVSDAMTDYASGSCTYGHCNSAFDPSNCTPLKTKATVGTIYTTYLPIYQNNDSTQGYDFRYTPLVLPYTAQFAPNMQSCATSSTLYYQASDGPGINTAMKALFAATLQAARLTQ